jgi:thiol-disulfide isomerase/thioredoxin
MVELTIYSRPDCHLCHEMKATVERVVQTIDCDAIVDEIDIGTNPDLEARYGLEIPVLLVDGKKAAKYRVSEEALRRLLTSRSSGTG